MIVYSALEQIDLHRFFSSDFFVISDHNVAPLYSSKINAPLITFPAGEENKSRKTKEEIEDALFQRGCTRKCGLIAMGGGVTLDLAGFVASTYARGISWIAVPTTLLAMCDAGIGGKTGVNTPYGKNLIGTFYPPLATIIDISFLKTLPQKELRSGFAEMIKHALIADPEYFAFLESNAENLEGEALLYAIQRSIEIKEKIVNDDLREGGLRRVLNFGHTFAHALEHVTHYAISHGDAVALGMLFEGTFSENFPQKRLFTLLKRLGFPLTFECTFDALYQAMQRDKKNQDQQPRFVMLRDLGEPFAFDGEYCRTTERRNMEEAFDALRHFERV
jgi:3-dehydroquinate synthase